MNTQEQLKTIIEVLVDFGLDKTQAYAIGKAVQAYGDNRFNEALDKVKTEFCSGKSELHNILSSAVESLKIPTS